MSIEASRVKISASDLVKVWSINRGSDFKQITIRVPIETFVKIQAIEGMFPHRSRNELVSDLLSTALEDFESGLPVTVHETDEVIGQFPDGEPIRGSFETGPRIDYRNLVEHLTNDLHVKSTDLAVLQTSQEAA